jgi:hypothetical protein
MSNKFVIGQRVHCKFPPSLVWRASEPQEFEGEIVAAGYRSDQWKVRPDYTAKVEMIHESFITPIPLLERQ